ncbi:MAG: PD-(D/E)XK nuclease family protein [bacterium]
MPRKPTLSPSRISVYLACPVKYRWSYIDPRGKFYMRSKPFYSFGTTLHRALQRFHQSGGAGVSTLQDVIADYESVWVDAGYESEESSQEHHELGKRFLESYVQAEEEAVITSHTLFVEKQLRKDMGDFYLVGRIDRVEEYDDGRIEIVDYKSGRTNILPEEVKTDLAMSIYQLLARYHYPEQENFATIIALRDNSRGSASLSNQELDELESDILFLANEILNADYMNLSPIYKPICRDCDFNPLCRRDTEFRSIFDAAEEDLKNRHNQPPT